MEKYSFRKLFNALQKPTPYDKGEAQFWDDEHISKGMLAAHLDQHHDAASRRIEIIDQTIANLFNAKILKEGDLLLDLGCGPGLYAAKLANRGVRVTGIDLSIRSIEYAREFASHNGLEIEYRCQNFFDMNYQNQFDCVTQIYGELNTFNDEDRDTLLEKIYHALKPDGYFVFDVTTRNLRKKSGAVNSWYTGKSGFWKPNEHIVFEQGFDYEELSLWLDQYVVIDESENISVYRNWFHDYHLDEIKSIVENIGFKVIYVFGDLTGTEYDEQGDWIALIIQK